tara:strand:+ start:411 stop:929 length:519 start_codon:yes stop_codon:yes gene_type:complete
MSFKIIVATCNDNGIGFNNKLPWEHIKEDMKLFSKLTIGNGNNSIIMGRKTFDSIGKPLKNRTNIILSNTLDFDEENLISFDNIHYILEYCKQKKFHENWVIGGETIYKQFLHLNLVDQIYQTKIFNNYSCDTFFPEIDLKFNIKNIKKINKEPCSILVIWKKRNIGNIFFQ